MTNNEKVSKIRSLTAPPMKSFEDSLKYVKSLYDTYTHNKFTKAEIASVLNFSASSGGFSYVLSAIRSFGLIVPDSDTFKVSELFKKIKIADVNTPEYKQLCYEAIRNVTLYSELLDEFKHKLPPYATIANRLEIHKQMSPASARTVAKLFEESLKHAGILDGNNNILLPRGQEETRNEISATEKEKTEENEDTEIASAINKGHKPLTLEIPLNEGRIAKIIYPHDMSKDEASKVSAVLNAIAG
jgi:hypothetical protein